ncbi:MAG: hypothetical protein IID36_14425, partial [Planctomycetes bacterium]|nr:hypothetical protein [Planctomycetota bacterium]
MNEYTIIGILRQVALSVLPITLVWSGCSMPPADTTTNNDNGSEPPVAEGIFAKLGDPLPSATPEQLEVFERGKEVFLRRFDLADGLGPAFNVTSCGSCHERPTPGGSSGLYRNFFLSGSVTDDGTFFP